MRTIRTSAQTLAPFRFSPRITCDPLGIPCQLCYKPAEGWSGSLEGCSHDDGAAFNIPRAIDPGGNLLQPGRDRLPLPYHAESRSDEPMMRRSRMPSPNNCSSTSPAPISINRFTSPASRISPRRSISVSAPAPLRHSRERPARRSCRSSAAAWRRTPRSVSCRSKGKSSPSGS